MRPIKVKDDLSEYEMAYLYDKFKNHRNGSLSERKIEFLLTFDEWLLIWIDSGHLHERGRKRGQYVMARNDDIGPYAIGNIRIVTNGTNNTEAHKGKKHTEEHKQKMSIALKGKKISEEHKQIISKRMLGNNWNLGRKHTEESKTKMSVSNKGRVISLAQRQKLSLANTGKRHSEASKQKMSERNKGKKLSNIAKHNISEGIKLHWVKRKQIYKLYK